MNGSDGRDTRPWLRGLAVGLLFMFIACDGTSPTSPSLSSGEPPTEDSVTVVSISPQDGATLQPGRRVPFEATINYQLASAASGLIRIVVQDQADNIIQDIARDPRQDRTVTRGSGSVSFSDTVTIPTTGVTSVHVFFPLFPEGVVSTSTVARVSYPVS